MSEFIIRPYNPSTDYNMISNSWLMSVLDCDSLRWIPRRIATMAYTAAIKGNLSPERVLVYSLSDDPDVIVGWFCFNASVGVIHYIYVKQAYRENGLAKDLITRAQQMYGIMFNTFSHWPKINGNHYILKRAFEYWPEMFWGKTTVEVVRKELDSRP